MKRFHLLVDGLAADQLAAFPHLAKLVARGRLDAEAADAGRSATLAHLFGVETRDLAAIALAAEGIDPGSLPWFHADPVHLLAGMHSLSVLDGRHFSLGEDETAQLVAALNSHFAGEIEFIAPHPRRWYACFKQALDVDAPPLDEVAGRTIAPDFVAGPDARALQRAAMEIQMVLHAHPVNGAREMRNEATINGLWLWGGGAYRQADARYALVHADDFAALSLAKAAGIAAYSLSDMAHADAFAAETLAVLHDIGPDSDADARWFKPLLAALRARKIDEVQLIAPGPAGMRLCVTSWQALAFWRNG